jgi:gamma-glutamyltranspeptidase
MNSLGGDGFWLISEPVKTPIGIDANGTAAQRATLEFYAGQKNIESRGGRAVTKGHDVATVPAFNELMGHAGAIVLRPDNSVAAATDPRSDGKAFAAIL